MALTSQYPQTRVHGSLALFGLARQVPEQDSGGVIDVEDNTLFAVTADLNYDWPLKSAQTGHPPHLKPGGNGAWIALSSSAGR